MNVTFKFERQQRNEILTLHAPKKQRYARKQNVYIWRGKAKNKPETNHSNFKVARANFVFA